MHQAFVTGLHPRQYGQLSNDLAKALAVTLESVPGLMSVGGVVVQSALGHSGRTVPSLRAFVVCDDRQVRTTDLKRLVTFVAEIVCVLLVEFARNHPVRATEQSFDMITATAMCGS